MQTRLPPELPRRVLLDGCVPQQFDALVTVDKSLRYQQNLTTRSFGVIVLRAQTNRLEDLLPLVPELLEVLQRIRLGEVIEIELPDVS